MKVSAELYGDKIAVDNNLSKMIEHKECSILLTLKSDDDKVRFQTILDKKDANSLVSKIVECFEEAVKYNFSIT